MNVYVTRRRISETYAWKHTCTYTQGRYNMINGGVSLTLINYNRIKDFISPDSGSALRGHTVNQRCVSLARRDSPLFPPLQEGFFFFLLNKVWFVQVWLAGIELESSPHKEAVKDDASTDAASAAVCWWAGLSWKAKQFSGQVVFALFFDKRSFWSL